MVDATGDVPVMAVGLDRPHEPGRRVRLLVNRGFFEGQPETFEGCLLHELHHVAYGHLDDAALHRVEHPRWMELAMELAANEGITAPLPPAFRWEDFADLGLAAGQSTPERYALLVAACARGDLELLTEAELDRRCPGWRDAATAGEGRRVVLWPDAPWRRLLDARPVDSHSAERCAGGGRGLGDALDEGSRRGGVGGLGAPDPEAQVARYFQAVRSWVALEPAAALQDVERRSRELDRAVRLASGRVDWREVLRRARGERGPQPTWSRPARRFPDRVGEVPGRVRRPAEPRVLAALDTSASMRAEWVDRAGGELRRLAQQARVTVAEVDARVHRTYPARPLDGVLGGGDTDLRAVFAGVGRRWDVVVYFTDGRGPWPEAPPAVPVVWALFGEGAFGCPWGLPLRL